MTKEEYERQINEMEWIKWTAEKTFKLSPYSIEVLNIMADFYFFNHNLDGSLKTTLCESLKKESEI